MDMTVYASKKTGRCVKMEIDMSGTDTEGLLDQINDLIEAVQVVVEKTPPQLASDVFDSGITLTGGGSLLYGLSEAIGNALNIPCQVSPDAKDCVVLGCAKVLTDPAGMRHLLANG